MEIAKFVDDILVSSGYKTLDLSRFCFVVYSSKEKHIRITIDCIESVIKEKENYDVKLLSEELKSGDSQLEELISLLKQCSFAIVVLDGFRPNVLFEYGIIRGLGKPCIVLLEKNAEIDVLSYFHSKEKSSLSNPKIDMDKHFSDVKDRFYAKYNKNNPKETRNIIKNEFNKLEKDIETEFQQMVFPDKSVIEENLNDYLEQLFQMRKNKNKLKETDEQKLKDIMKTVEGIASDYRLKLSSFYYVVIGEIMYSMENYTDALTALQNAELTTNTKKQRLYIYHKIAITYAKLEETEKALDAFNRAIELDPSFEPIWHDKGNLLDTIGKKDEAMMCYKKGIEFNESCSGIHFSYGIILYEKNSTEDALEQFEKALELKSFNAKYMIWKARALNKLGRQDDAKKVLEESLCYDNENDNAWFTLGQMSSNSEEALEYFEKALKCNPQHQGALCSKGAALSNIGEFDDAIEIFKRMKKKCSRFKPGTCKTLLYNLANTFSRKKEYLKALEYIEIAVSLNPNDEEVLHLASIILFKLAKEQHKKNLYSEVIKTIDRVLDLKGNDANALLLKGISLSELEKNDESLDILKRAVELNPEDGQTLYNYSCVLAKVEMTDESLIFLEKSIKLNPDFTQMAKEDNDFKKIKESLKFKTLVSDL